MTQSPQHLLAPYRWRFATALVIALCAVTGATELCYAQFSQPVQGGAPAGVPAAFSPPQPVARQPAATGPGFAQQNLEQERAARAMAAAAARQQAEKERQQLAAQQAAEQMRQQQLQAEQMRLRMLKPMPRGLVNVRPLAVDVRPAVAPPVPVIDPAARAQAEANRENKRNAYVVRYIKQLYFIYLAELELIRQTCDVPVADRAAIRTAGAAALRKVAGELADIAIGIQDPAARRRHTNCRDEVVSALYQALAGKVSNAQRAKYLEVTDQRAKLQKRGTISAIVNQLDDTLYLSPEQRQRITASLYANWNDHWVGYLNYVANPLPYMPSMPVEIVNSHLTRSQQQIWLGIHKVSLQGAAAFGGRAPPLHPWWDGKEGEAAEQVPGGRPRRVSGEVMRAILDQF